ncbi:MAG: WD40 repeat domain-containing protein [Arcobacter sp.]|jgi:WD40 repeat protein|uniref:WD40 repeat domain-containing protein n=1 Tax=Arcobacter sp. TaxID=1872629 RepID=UPI002A7658C9|nr:WD40 repeat domain-containing protein [Arcobacter sp.]MDY3199881.1 WD40 repeat domain-containing protein [Arcobacter sp.]
MNILKSFFTIIILLLNLNAKELEPNSFLSTSGGVTDLIIDKNRLFAATTASSVDIFDITTKEKIDSINLPKIKDFIGDTIDSKIYSVDVFDDKILILSQGENGGRNISLYKDGKLTHIIEDKQRLFIARAKFLDENHIIYALLSNQIYLYDIKNKTITKEIQISQSKFSNFKLSRDKTKVVVCDESGVLTMLDSNTFNIIKTFKNQNLDNVFQVDFKNKIILTAGQDRRSAVFSEDGKMSYYKEFSFLIYSAGLSPSGNLAAVASDEENNVTIFNTNTKEELFLLTKNRNTLTNILFLNENEIFVSSDDNKINYYKIN